MGFLVGWLLAILALWVLNLNAFALLAVGFFVAILTFTINNYMFSKPNMTFGEKTVGEDIQIGVRKDVAVDDILSHEDKWNMACATLAKQYGLSPRQNEVFILLARGRNVQHIREDLVLATSTTKSHIYSIYQKMGVHSQQELIDLMETTINDL